MTPARVYKHFKPHGAFLTTFLAIILISCSPKTGNAPLPLAEKGTMDLTGLDLAKDGPVPLAGEWECYWEGLYEPGPGIHWEGITRFYLELPCEWNHRTVEGRPLPGFGYATHRLTVRLREKQAIVGLKLQDMATAYRLYVNGRIVAENGKVGTSREKSVPRLHPQVAIFRADSDTLEFVLQVSNFHHRLGGPWFPILLGTEKQVRQLREDRVALDLFLLGSLLIIGVYHLALFILRTKERSPLWLALFTFLMALRILVQGEHLLLNYVPAIPFELHLKLNYLTFYLAVPLFAMFFRSLFPDEFSGKVTKAIIALYGACSLLVIAAPARIYTHTFVFCEVMTITACLYLMAVAVLAAVRKRSEAHISLVAFVVLTATIVNDMLYGHFLYGMEFLIPLGYLFYLLAQAFLLSKRFSRAFAVAEDLYRELDHKNLELMRLDKMKDQFLASTTHELKTPLSGIIGIAESNIAGATGHLPEKTVRDLSLVVSSGKRLTGLINDLLDFSRLKNRELHLEYSPTDIKSISDIAIDLNRPYIDQTRVAVRNNIGTSLPTLWADKNRLQQVMLNLINNAAKFTESGTIEINARVIEGDRRCLEVTVADTGIGIKKETIPSLFQIFSQGDDTIPRRFGGSGLGLAIAKELVTLHEGTINVQSEEGKGSVFAFTIPYRTRAEIDRLSRQGTEARSAFPPPLVGVHLPPQNEHQPADDGAPGDREYTILVVDDDQINCRVLENHLTLKKYKVIIASNGEDALGIIEGGLVPDLVLLDIMMPKLTGYEVLKRLRLTYSPHELPVMFITAKNRAADLIAGFESGANDYLEKPFEKHELLARVRTLVTMKQAVQKSGELTAIKKEIEIAREIQQSIIPKSPPSVPGLAIDTHYIPMDRVGGDFYLFNPSAGTRLGICISDVAGHGLPAALIASMAQMIISLMNNETSPPGELLKEINNVFINKVEQQFITVGYLTVDAADRKAWYARAGHEPLLVHRRKEGTLTEIMPRGIIMGLKNDYDYETTEIALDSGDRIILYTDCITEMVGSRGDYYGYERFREFILENGSCAVRDFSRRLIDHLREWSGGKKSFDDDLTLIVVDIL